ncbi:MAG: YbjQ family protein [Chlorobiales bacterium]|nr:YbjQ family protein [Chlorobiales bacterium]
MRKLFLALLVLISCAGCSSVANLKTDDLGSQVFNLTSAESIKVYSTSDAGREYKVIGQVVADADAGKEAKKAVNLLKEEAAKLGADAIVNLRLEIDAGYWNSAIKATGTAVKFQN